MLPRRGRGRVAAHADTACPSLTASDPDRLSALSFPSIVDFAGAASKITAKPCMVCLADPYLDWALRLPADGDVQPTLVCAMKPAWAYAAVGRPVPPPRRSRTIGEALASAATRTGRSWVDTVAGPVVMGWFSADARAALDVVVRVVPAPVASPSPTQVAALLAVAAASPPGTALDQLWPAALAVAG